MNDSLLKLEKRFPYFKRIEIQTQCPNCGTNQSIVSIDCVGNDTITCFYCNQIYLWPLSKFLSKQIHYEKST